MFYRFGGQQRRLTTEPSYPTTAKAATAAAAERAQRDTIKHVSAEFIKRHVEAKGRPTSDIDDVQRTFNQVVIPAWRDRRSARSPAAR